MRRMAAAVATVIALIGTLAGGAIPTAGAGGNAECPGSWTILPSPNRHASTNVLSDVSAMSPTEAMAVGWFGEGPGDMNPLVERWDGARWRLAPSPDVGGGHAALVAVSALRPNDVWAVGYRVVTYGTNKTFAAHWDGSGWTISDTPNPRNASAQFTDVEAIATDDVWAVGIRTRPADPERTLVQHWDGTGWSVVPSPNVELGDNYHLSTVTAVDPDDVWAVGYWGALDSETHLSPLYEHWDGTRWSVVGSELQSTASFLLAAVAISTDDVVAVGSNGDFESGYIHKPLVRRWDGGSWFDPFLPIPDGGDISFLGVAATGSADVWALGYQTPASNHQTLAEHWDGTAWTICVTPNRTSEDNELIGANAGSGVVWAVGTYVPSGSELTRTLAERWSGS